MRASGILVSSNVVVRLTSNVTDRRKCFPCMQHLFKTNTTFAVQWKVETGCSVKWSLEAREVHGLGGEKGSLDHKSMASCQLQLKKRLQYPQEERLTADVKITQPL